MSVPMHAICLDKKCRAHLLSVTCLGCRFHAETALRINAFNYMPQGIQLQVAGEEEPFTCQTCVCVFVRVCKRLCVCLDVCSDDAFGRRWDLTMLIDCMTSTVFAEDFVVTLIYFLLYIIRHVEESRTASGQAIQKDSGVIVSKICVYSWALNGW